MWTSSTVGVLPASEAGVRESKVRISAVDVWKRVVGLAFLAARLSARHVALRAMIVNDALDPLKVCPFRSHQSQGETKDQDKGGVFNVKTTGVWTKLRSHTTAAEHGSVIPDGCAGKLAEKELFLIPRFLHSGFFPISIPISHQPSQILSTVAAKTSKVMPSIPWKRDENLQKK